MNPNDEVALDYVLACPEQEEPLLEILKLIHDMSYRSNFLRIYKRAMVGKLAIIPEFTFHGEEVGGRMCLRSLLSHTRPGDVLREVGRRFTLAMYHVPPEQEAFLWRLACVCQERPLNGDDIVPYLARPVNEGHALIEPWLRVEEVLLRAAGCARENTHIHIDFRPTTFLVSFWISKSSGRTVHDVNRASDGIREHFGIRPGTGSYTLYEERDAYLLSSATIPYDYDTPGVNQFLGEAESFLEALEARRSDFDTREILSSIRTHRR